jgi:hypothetical protein
MSESKAGAFFLVLVLLILLFIEVYGVLMI